MLLKSKSLRLILINKNNSRKLSNELSIHQSKKLNAVETKIFRRLKTPYERFHVPIYDDKYKIWTLKANPQAKNIPIVLIHGFLASITVWRYNIDALSELRPLYAIDLLGFGQSSRANFSQDPLEVEDQFIESIEEWRTKMNLDEFILLGHSFGAYLSASYTLRYPKHINALILNDPWGFNDAETEKLLCQIKNFIEATYRNAKSKFDLKKFQYLFDSLLIIKYFYYADYFKRIRYLFLYFC
jgi:pimeloyl-ACP methyl ester carboxylesterase